MGATLYIVVVAWWIPTVVLSVTVASGAEAQGPPEVPGGGARVLRPLGSNPQSCKGEGGDRRDRTVLPPRNTIPSREQDAARWRQRFVCTAGCSEREPELEHSLAPFAEWERNTSGLEMIDLMWGFCNAQRSCKDPFVMVVLWQGDVFLRACGAGSLKDESLYLIGPEDLSLVLTFLFAAQRVAVLPPGPIAFGIYLSDYTCLVDRHLVGPGVPIFAYIRRDTSWAIPWPSSFTVHSTQMLEKRQAQFSAQNFLRRGKGGPAATKAWHERDPRAYWIGTVTGPWEVAADAALAAVPRLQLLRLARDHPKQLQVEWSNAASYGISWVSGVDRVEGLQANGSRSIEALTGVRRAGFKPLDEWEGFKYYVNVDGVVMGGRFNKLLASGGVVLQHNSGYYEHVNALAKPFVHYVPIEYDLSDLIAKVEWLQGNDAEAQRIAARARALASERMRLEDHLCYVWRALEGLGAKTASAAVDARAVDRRLAELGFQRVTVVNESMRQTMESLWGSKLEDVATGDRVMTANGINLVQWTWDRFGNLWKQAHA